MGAAALCRLSLAYTVHCDLWTELDQLHSVCSSCSLNQCGYVVVSWFLVILRARSWTVSEQVHMMMLWLPPLCSSLLEAFVVQSSLFVQLESSTGFAPTLHLPRSWLMEETLGLCISPCSQREPSEAIRFVWNWKLTFCLLLMSLFRFSNVWQTVENGQNTVASRALQASKRDGINLLPNTSQVMTKARRLLFTRQIEWERILFKSN